VLIFGCRCVDASNETSALPWWVQTTSKMTPIYEHYNRSFWMGDLNYRIDLPRAEVVERAGKREWEALLAADQLVRERGAGRVFQGYTEGPIAFAPSYKFDRTLTARCCTGLTLHCYTLCPLVATRFVRALLHCLGLRKCTAWVCVSALLAPFNSKIMVELT
jgi:hypothetical protein